MHPEQRHLHSVRPRSRRGMRGLTIVELMVGMVVALLVALAAAGSAQMFNASQRQAMSSGAASLNIASTLAAVKNDVANAGLGFFGNGAYVCATLNLSNGGTLLSNSAPFSPVRITRGATNDTLVVVSATDVSAAASVRLKAATAGDSAMLRSLMPVTVTPVTNPTVLLGQSGAGAGLCTVRSVTANTPADAALESPQTLQFGNTGVHNQAAFAVAPNYAEDDLLSNLGSLTWNTYSVNANRELVITQVMQGNSAVLATNVIAFRAEYGVSAAAGNPTLSGWQDANAFGPVTAANITQIRAVRLGVVVRGRQPEKADSDVDGCRTTTQMPRVFPEDAAVVTPDLPSGQWQCYRYRVATVVVPLRNTP